MTRSTQSFSRLFLIASVSVLTFTACGATPEDLDDTSFDYSDDDSTGSLSEELASQITVTGRNAADVSPTVTGTGSINVFNDGAHVAATQAGSGSINIVNKGGVLTASNTGAGVMTINSTATGAVTVTNTGNGRVTVTAAGAAAIALTHNGDADFTYP
jgi:hypothetical protein